MKKLLIVVVIWGLILGGGAAAYYYLFQGKTDYPKVVNGGDKDKDHGPRTKVKLALDSFSGYCIFRSDEFKKNLADQAIDYEYADDGADYPARMKTLQSGETPLAVFTIDALLNATPTAGEPPATILMVIDESRGADAIVGLPPGMPDPDPENLNRSDVKIVLVPNSPSETLVRVVRKDYDLSNLPPSKTKYLVSPRGDDTTIKDVYQQFKGAKATDPTAFVLWEPFVSKALQERPETQLLADSSQFKERIVDVLVAQKAWLAAHPKEAGAVVQAYLEVLHTRRQSPNGMVDLVRSDAAEKLRDPLTPEEAAAVVSGVWWKNAMENYAHFGLLPPGTSKDLSLLGDVIRNIRTVLDQTKESGAPSPAGEQPDKLYDRSVLAALYGQSPPFQIDEPIRDDVAKTLSDEEWGKLRRIGSKTQPIGFMGGLATFSHPDTARAQLSDIAERMRRSPHTYLRVEGHAEGMDVETAQQRADAVKDYLVKQLGDLAVPAYRIRAEGKAGGAKQVDFVLLQAR